MPLTVPPKRTRNVALHRPPEQLVMRWVVKLLPEVTVRHEAPCANMFLTAQASLYVNVLPVPDVSAVGKLTVMVHLSLGVATSELATIANNIWPVGVLGGYNAGVHTMVHDGPGLIVTEYC